MSHNANNQGQGDNGFWNRSGDHITTPIPTNATASKNWALVGDGDFDGDGDQDLLWRHSSGANTIWELEDGLYVVNHNLPIANENWRVVQVRDFDDDGDDDIRWDHRNDGGSVVWEIEDCKFVAHHRFADHIL